MVGCCLRSRVGPRRQLNRDLKTSIQSSLFVVSPQYSVNPPTRLTNSYPALQIFTCYRGSPVTLPDFGGSDGGTISGIECIHYGSVVFLRKNSGNMFSNCLAHNQEWNTPVGTEVESSCSQYFFS